MIETFIIETPESDIADLKERLRRTRWPNAPVESGWGRGTSPAYLRELADYWRDAFSWREHEARLNQLEHFRANVDGLRLHFIRASGKGPRPLPLMLLHGWPSSFAEMLKIIPLLTDADDSFDVIVPSLPGYGYSEAPAGAETSIWKAAELLRRVMKDVLGYSTFFVSGGDWGAYAASYLAFTYPQDVPAFHLSFIPGGLAPAISRERQPYSSAEIQLLKHRAQWEKNEGGYEHLQSTKPQTVAYALNDSPVGLAAWIVEKMRSWSDCGGNLESVFSKDELLTNISIYWFTRTIGSSVRMYFETSQNPWGLPEGRRIETPSAIAVFPKELSVPPREWAERIYNVQQWTQMPKGGHFAAAEQPELLARDIQTFFARFR